MHLADKRPEVGQVATRLPREYAAQCLLLCCVRALVQIER